MSQTQSHGTTPTTRPETLSSAWLLRRAGIGLFILVATMVASMMLYDASIRANASVEQSAPNKSDTSSSSAPKGVVITRIIAAEKTAQ